MLIIDAQDFAYAKNAVEVRLTIQTVTHLLIHYPNKVQKDSTH